MRKEIRLIFLKNLIWHEVGKLGSSFRKAKRKIMEVLYRYEKIRKDLLKIYMKLFEKKGFIEFKLLSSKVKYLIMGYTILKYATRILAQLDRKSLRKQC